MTEDKDDRTMCDQCEEPFFFSDGEIDYFPEEDMELCCDCQEALGAGYCEYCDTYKVEMTHREDHTFLCITCDEVMDRYAKERD